MNSRKIQDEAGNQRAIDRTGPFSIYHLPQLVGYFTSDAILSSREFGELDTKIETPLQAETKTSYEMFLVSNTVSHT